VTESRRARVELAFYPFEDVRWAYHELWSAVAARCDWVAREPSWPDDPTTIWHSSEKFVSQTCGWPLVTYLADKVRVVGTFRHTTPESASHFYRSVVVGRVDGTPFDFQGAIGAINETDSLSGWISLIAAIFGPQETWRGPFRVTGSHEESIRMLGRGEADVASIDSVTFAHFKRLYPEIISSLFVICNGPLVPCLPIITHKSVTDAELATLRDALGHASRDKSLSRATSTLFISGFDPLDLDDYLPLRNLTPNT